MILALRVLASASVDIKVEKIDAASPLIIVVRREIMLIYNTFSYCPQYSGWIEFLLCG